MKAIGHLQKRRFKGIYDPEKIILEDRKKKTWLQKKHYVKYSPTKDYEEILHWQIHEYIAAKLYSYYIGQSISKTKLHQSVGVTYTLTENTPRISHYDVSTQKIGGVIPFECFIAKECTVTFDKKKKPAIVESISNHPGVEVIYQSPNSIRMSKIEGFEYAWLVSNFIYDGDIDRGNKFALYSHKSNRIITRTDFDDSLKFIDIFRLTKSPTYLLSPKGRYDQFNIDLIYRFIDGKMRQSLIDTEFLKAFESMIKLNNQTVVFSIVDKAIEDLSTYCFDQQLKSLYYVEKMNCSNSEFFDSNEYFNGLPKREYYEQVTRTSSTNPLDKLGSFIKCLLLRRMDDAKIAYECFKLEQIIHNNDVIGMQSLIKNHCNGDHVLPLKNTCLGSFYNPVKERKYGFLEDYIFTNLAKAYKYNNEAATLFNNMDCKENNATLPGYIKPVEHSEEL